MRTVIIALLLALASSAYGEIYTWKDKRGTEFFTNSLYEIPARYRSKAKLLDVPTGKRLPIGAAPAPSPQAAPAPSPQTAPAPTAAPIAVQPSPNQAAPPSYQPGQPPQPAAGALGGGQAPAPESTTVQRPASAPGQMPRVPRRTHRRPVPAQNNPEGE